MSDQADMINGGMVLPLETGADYRAARDARDAGAAEPATAGDAIARLRAQKAAALARVRERQAALSPASTTPPGVLARALAWARSPSPIGGLSWGVVVGAAVVAGVVIARRRKGGR